MGVQYHPEIRYVVSDRLGDDARSGTTAMPIQCHVFSCCALPLFPCSLSFIITVNTNTPTPTPGAYCALSRTQVSAFG